MVPKAKKISIHDVAKRAGVSAATVSNVMNRRRTTEDEIAAKVKKASSELGYQPDRAASNLRSGKARVIAVLVPSIENPFFSALVARIECLARDDGYELIVGASNESGSIETSRLAALLAWRPVGLIVVPAVDAFPSHTLIDVEQTPYVVVDRTSENLAADVLAVDNHSAGVMALDHLADLGCRTILVAASSLSIHNMKQRCEGVAAAASTRALNHIEYLEAGTEYQEASHILHERLANQPRPDAVLAMTNVLTLSTLSACVAHEIAIPEDMAVLGFDDYEWMQARKTPITAISQPVSKLAEAAWERLKTRMGGENLPPREYRFDCQLHPRASTLGYASEGELAVQLSQGPVSIRGSPAT